MKQSIPLIRCRGQAPGSRPEHQLGESAGPLSTPWAARPRPRSRAGRSITLACGLSALAALLLVGPSASAQAPRYTLQPYDVIVLANGAKEYKVYPLPDRSTKKRNSGRLDVRLLDQPEDERSVNWAAIERIDFFEELVLQDAEALVAKEEFDKAFLHFSFLAKQYPQTRGLGDALQSFLFKNGVALVRQDRLPEALSTLEELYSINPAFAQGSATVTAGISAVCSRIVQGYVESQNYVAARTLLERLNDQYGATRLPSIATWARELARLADEQKTRAAELFQAGELRQANLASRKMMEIWPRLKGAAELAQAIARRYPIVTIGVTAEAPADASGQRQDWASRRVARLLQRSFLEFAGAGPEGGQYLCPQGVIEHNEENLAEFSIGLSTRSELADASLTGYELSRQLLDLANPQHENYVPAWGSLLAGVELEGVSRVRLALRRPHVLPEAELAAAMMGDHRGTPLKMRPYLRRKADPERLKALMEENPGIAGEALYALNPDYAMKRPTQPAEIIERVYKDTADAVEGLLRGEVDAVDRVFPAEAARLKSDPSLVVGAYASPVVHLLIPNLNNPYLANATFRQALVYAIDRQRILRQVLLEGQSLPGCQVVSGPFPAGRTRDDPISYAYDDRIAPLPTDPGQALLLTHIAKRELELFAQAKEEEPPAWKPLVLAHPPSKAARLACAVIAQELGRVDIEVTLKELPLGREGETQGEYDLTYVEYTVTEPIVDARRILGADGLAASNSPYVNLALQRLDAGTNWKELSERLRDIHKVVHDRVTVVPLWQITEHFAHRPWLTGISQPTPRLYQDVERWQLEPGRSPSQTTP